MQRLFGLFILVMVFSGAARAAETGGDAPTDYAIIVTGGELLRGVYPDGHTHFITRTLGPLGCRCVGSISVGDEYDDLFRALDFFSRQVKLILVTGGLGPTDDDVTRQALTRFTGIPLKENPDVIAELMRRFNASSKDDLRANMRRQAMTPERGDYLPNPNGTAVGLVFDDGDRVIACMPGPPRELQPMVKNELIPRLSQRFGIHTVGASLTMRFVNIGESQIDETLHKYVELPPELMISSLFEFGRVDLTFFMPGDSPEERQTLRDLESKLIVHLNGAMYSDRGQTLEERIIELLAEKNKTLVAVEAGSGGAVSAALYHAEGAPAVFEGGYVAPDDRVLWDMLNLTGDYPADPLQRAQALVAAARKKTGASMGLAVGEAFEDSGGRFAWYVLMDGDEAMTERFSVRDTSEYSHSRLLNSALDKLRSRLLDIQ
ncbi:MAG: hypothetical protein GC154_09930 [bacterium]|nr:hypothetical protein [bacterium]